MSCSSDDMATSGSGAAPTLSSLSSLLDDPLGLMSPSVTSTVTATEEQEEDMPTEFPLGLRLSVTLVCLVVLAIGTAGNVLVPIVVCRTKELRNSTNLFLINLSIADLLVLLVCVPTMLIELHSRPETWTLGPVMCKLVPFTEYSVACASILTMLAISLERYYAICKPLKAGYKCTRLRALIIIAVIWVVSFLSTGPLLVYTVHTTTVYNDGSIVPVCATQICSAWHRTYYMTFMALFFWLPLVVLIVIYFLIMKRLVLDSKLDPDLVQHSEAAQTRARRQVVIMLAAVVICFFLCLLPFRLFTNWLVLTPNEQIYELGMVKYYSLLYTCRVLIYVNSAINPILYNVISSKFREAFMTVLCCRPNGSRRALMRQSTFNTTSSSMALSLKSGAVYPPPRQSTLTDLSRLDLGGNIMRPGGKGIQLSSTLDKSLEAEQTNLLSNGNSQSFESSTDRYRLPPWVPKRAPPLAKCGGGGHPVNSSLDETRISSQVPSTPSPPPTLPRRQNSRTPPPLPPLKRPSVGWMSRVFAGVTSSPNLSLSHKGAADLIARPEDVLLDRPATKMGPESHL